VSTTSSRWPSLTPLATALRAEETEQGDLVAASADQAGEALARVVEQVFSQARGTPRGGRRVASLVTPCFSVSEAPRRARP
jgi:hypothetical protein